MTRIRNPLGAIAGFLIHATIFAIFAFQMVWINHQSADERWWPWPVIGWGIGVAFHGFGTLSSIVNFATGGLLRNGPLRPLIGLAWHWISYLIVIGGLAAMNILTNTPTFWHHPALGWGFGLLLHTAGTIFRLFRRGLFAARSF